MFLLSRCERAVWSTIEFASSVDLLGQNANWSVSRVSGMMVLESHLAMQSWVNGEYRRGLSTHP